METLIKFACPSACRCCGWVLLLVWSSATLADDGAMIRVTANPGQILDGNKVLSEVPQGTQLWAFRVQDNFAEVKVPNSEQHGWLASTSWKQLTFSEADKAKLSELAEQAKTITGGGEKKKQLYEQYRAAYRAVHGEESLHYAGALRAIAYRLESECFDYELSEQYLTQSLAISRKLVGNEHSYTVDCLNCLYLLFSNSGDFGKARTNLDEAIQLSKRVHEPESGDVALLLGNLGGLLLQQGDHPAARKALHEAIRLYRRNPDYCPDCEATALVSLGNIHTKLGDYAVAQRHYQESLAIYRQHAEKKWQNMGYVLLSMGILNTQIRNDAQAQKDLDESLAFYLREHPHSNLLSSVYQAQGDLALRQDDHPRAEQHFTQAMKLARQTWGNEHVNVANLLVAQGELALARKQHDTAWEQYHAALELLQRIFGQEHPQTMVVLGKLALLSAHEQEHDVAARQFDQFRKIQQRYAQYLLPFLSADEQLTFLDHQYQPNLQAALAFAYKCRDEETLINYAASWLFNGKGIAQESLAVRELMLRDAAHPAYGAQVRELQELRARLASQSLAAVKPDQIAAQQAALTRLTTEEHRLAQQLFELTGQQFSAKSWIELSELRRRLTPGSLYVDIGRVSLPADKNTTTAETPPKAPEHYLAWVIAPHREGKVQLLDLGAVAPIHAAIERARAAVAQTAVGQTTLQNNGETAAAKLTNIELQAVADLVLKPLLPQLANKKHLILSPDGALWLLPWAALPVADNKCLIEQCSLRYVTSGRDLVKSRSSSKLEPGAPAIVVNPDYDLVGAAAKTALQKLLPQLKVAQSAALGETSRSSLPRVAALPFTSAEGAAAKPSLEQLAKSAPRLYEQHEALETVVKKIQRPKHLLLSTHGFFLPDQERKETDDKQLLASSDTRSLPALTKDGQPIENPLLRCGLLFAGCNAPRTPGLDDGILTGLEIVGMDLRGTELVVLSACETGIGKVRNGEGVAGLRQAFQLAGAQSVVSTLWQVPDRDSALIMQDFFTNLAAGQSKADALRNAQLKRIAARKEKSGAAHPFFWAAWTVTGE